MSFYPRIAEIVKTGKFQLKVQYSSFCVKDAGLGLQGRYCKMSFKKLMWIVISKCLIVIKEVS